MSKSKSGFFARVFGRKPRTALAQQRPRPIGESVPRGAQWAFDQTIERRFATSTTTGAAITEIIRAYEQAENGFVEDMVDLFERRIETDAHLRAALDNRNEAVSQKSWTVEPGAAAGQETQQDRDAAGELERRLRIVPNFVATLEHQLTFQPYGWAASEMTWELVDGLASPVWFQDIAHRRFRFQPENDEQLLRTVREPNGEILTPGKWWWTCRRGRLTATSGLMRTLLWWSTFKTLAMRDWMIFAERFGIPYVTGQYDESISDQDKAVLENAVRDLGADGFAIFSDKAKIVIHELQSAKSLNSNEGIHGSLVGVCDNQISFLVEGATLVSSVDGPGSHALGKVHENRYHDILQGDAERLSQSFEANVGLPFVRFNGLKARPPRLKMHLGLNLNLTDQIDNLLKLANGLEGFEVDEEQIRSQTLLRKPREGEGLRGLEFAKIEGGSEHREEDRQ